MTEADRIKDEVLAAVREASGDDHFYGSWKGGSKGGGGRPGGGGKPATLKPGAPTVGGATDTELAQHAKLAGSGATVSSFRFDSGKPGDTYTGALLPASDKRTQVNTLPQGALVVAARDTGGVPKGTIGVLDTSGITKVDGKHVPVGRVRFSGVKGPRTKVMDSDVTLPTNWASGKTKLPGYKGTQPRASGVQRYGRFGKKATQGMSGGRPVIKYPDGSQTPGRLPVGHPNHDPGI